MKLDTILKIVGAGFSAYQTIKTNREQRSNNTHGSTNNSFGRAVQRGISNFRDAGQEYQRLNQNGVYRNVSSRDLLDNLNQKDRFSMTERAAMLHELEKRSNNK